ncbi:Sodium/solute symporter superfamily [Sesbania bispinosa]|nr:Sodium/solute symporter superfamily [Sesbania bispinosa]
MVDRRIKPNDAVTTGVGLVVHYICGQPGPDAIVIRNGLTLSSTAVVLQVLQERGESTSRNGKATFSVLPFQDLAVVVLLILIPLISPSSSKGGGVAPLKNIDVMKSAIESVVNKDTKMETEEVPLEVSVKKGKEKKHKVVADVAVGWFQVL